MPYVNKGTHMGSGLVAGARGTAGAIASRALLRSLQDMGMSVVSPRISLDGTLPSNKTWKTNVATLPQALIETYNRTRGDLRLSPAQYGVRYSGSFDASHGRFRYLISAELFQRGALSKWSPVKDDRYFGDFFVTHLADQVKVNLNAESAT
jgi:hypothetical protein